MRIPCWAAVGAALAAGALLATPAPATVLHPKNDADLILRGRAPGDVAGFAFAQGDFDGDGTDDLAVGAPGVRPNPDSGPQTGTTYILFGGPGVPSRWPGGLGAAPVRLVGTRARHMVGHNLAAGDFDRDGRADLLIGAPWTTEGDTSRFDGGAAYVVFGRARSEFPAVLPLPEGADVVLVSPAREVHLGEWLACGDIDGDGWTDLAVGAMYANGPDGVRLHAGAAYVVRGRPRGKFPKRIDVSKDADLTIHGAERDDTAGRSLAAADWNGDGRADLLVGAYYGDGPGNARSDPGEAYIVLGRPSREMGRKKPIDFALPGAGVTVYGAWGLGAFGRSSAAGDLDGDGLGDFAVGAYRAPETGDRALAGVVEVLFGRREVPQSIDLAETSEFRILGGAYWDHMGRWLEAGDLDGDGKADLLVGGPYADPRGPDGTLRLQAGVLGIVMGRARGEFPDSLDLATGSFDHAIEGEGADDQLPGAMNVLDIDGDGKRDLVVGAPFADGRADEMPECGEVYFFLGASRSWSIGGSGGGAAPGCGAVNAPESGAGAETR